MKNNNSLPFLSSIAFVGLIGCATPQSAQNTLSQNFRESAPVQEKMSKEELKKLFPEYKRSEYLDFLLENDIEEGLYHDPEDDNRPYAVGCSSNPDSKKALEEAQQEAEKILAEDECLGTSKGADIYDPESKTAHIDNQVCIAVTGIIICSADVEVKKLTQRMNDFLDAIDNITKESERLIQETEKEIQ